MRIVYWQTILMKYHALIFQKLGKMSQFLSSAKVLIGALKVKNSPSFENKGKWARLRWLSDYFSQISP